MTERIKEDNQVEVLAEPFEVAVNTQEPSTAYAAVAPNFEMLASLVKLHVIFCPFNLNEY